jgi:hypothetical protein
MQVQTTTLYTGAKPTNVSCNTSVAKIHNAANSVE